MRELVLVLAAAATLAACSKSDSPSGPPPPGCVFVSGTCTARAGLTAADCAGTFRPEGCPQTNVVGTCIDAQGEIVVFYAPTYNTYFAHLYCDANAANTFIGTGAPEVTTACDMTAMGGTCTDVRGPQDEVVVVMQWCGTAGGVESSAPCTASGRTGTCSTTSGGVAFDERYYDPATAASDAAACTGTWTAK